ncbi:PREDICTED: uncharacterized protein LOC106806463 [Priapulus caudatus]|uniref:Uncharacterized protein LOC106806463 n=1 Tax=Priapulus caudatus TaxID=37621 RepID=A0ABM1DVB7_PRICU|nr:PREDICTED: uncharacterized protein LOC106806463 [Priapulus caudatus]
MVVRAYMYHQQRALLKHRNCCRGLSRIDSVPPPPTSPSVTMTTKVDPGLTHGYRIQDYYGQSQLVVAGKLRTANQTSLIANVEMSVPDRIARVLKVNPQESGVGGGAPTRQNYAHKVWAHLKIRELARQLLLARGDKGQRPCWPLCRHCHRGRLHEGYLLPITYMVIDDQSLGTNSSFSTAYADTMWGRENRRIAEEIELVLPATALPQRKQMHLDATAVTSDPLSVYLKWNTPADIESSYYVHYTTNNSLPEEEWDVMHGSQRTADILTNLSPETTYFIKVTLENGHSSDTVHFTTSLVPANSPVNIKSLDIKSEIGYRYAKTFINMHFQNFALESQETLFNIQIPKTAIIVNFTMETDGNIYTGLVKEFKKAEETYRKAKKEKKGAAIVTAEPRDAKAFNLRLNVKPRSVTVCRLEYEQLLERKLGVYEHAIILKPNQLVRDLKVNVYITEPQPITYLHVPPLRAITGVIDEDREKADNQVAMVQHDSGSGVAWVSYSPTLQQQMEFLGGSVEGQLILKYDIANDKKTGDIQVHLHTNILQKDDPLK